MICHTCALADKGYTVIISGVFLLPCRKRTFVILSHFKASEMAKSLELLGAPPLGPLPGFCPGPAGWLTAPPDPQLFQAMTVGHCDSQASLNYARNQPPHSFCGNYGPVKPDAVLKRAKSMAREKAKYYGARKCEIVRNLNSNIMIRKVEYYNTKSRIL